MSARVRRFDAGELAPPHRNASGFLIADGRISRVGIQEYEDGNGKTHRELRLAEDVFSDASIASFRSVPITNTHPPELVTPATAKRYAVGALEGKPIQDGDFLKAPIVIYDAEAIAAAEAGRSQLSCGYTCQLDPTQDPELIQKWGPYDFIQRDIQGNHVALVDAARAGPEARLRLDSQDAAVISLVRPLPTRPPETKPMPQIIRIDGLTLEATEANATAIQQAIDRAAATAKERADAAVANERTRADGAEKKLRIVKDNAVRIIGVSQAMRAFMDAMKARNMGCDECGGSGKVMDEGVEKTCGYCDGKGSFRMHDKFADVVAPEGPDGDEPEAAAVDQTELEVEQETETEAAKAHGDRKRADARKRRADDAAAARKARRDSFDRRVKRAVFERTALLDEARKHLGAEADLAKLDAGAIKRQVIEKLCPGAKLDGKSAAQIDARYDAEIERVTAAQLDGADQARQATAPAATGGSAPRVDALPDPDGARAAMMKRNAEAAAAKK